ncbi:MAG TPA: AAA family ATPase [Nostocaceae cyanobacterium]|nr:AAA family ATPase [Nostocaceae cyanobacterium]
MEKLIVKNFLNLREGEFNLSKISIVFEPQVNGNSIVARLIYFFKKFFLEYHDSILKQLNKEEFNKHIMAIFNEIFAEECWNIQKFEIIYYLENNYVKLYTEKLDEHKYQLFLDYSEYLVKIRSNLLEEYPKNFSTNSISPFIEGIIGIQTHEILSKYLFSGEEKITTLDFLTFIPTNRTFFANLENFSFFSNNAPVDYFIKEFASDYELMKKLYNDRIFLQEEHKEKIEELVKKVILGNYVYENGQDWIYTDTSKKINLSHSSAAQKELLPMVLTLVLLPFSNWCNRIFIIEKPEAHLFPESQNYIVSLISLIFNLAGNKNKFVITTHSPYILTAFNKLIQARHTLKMLRDKSKTEELIDKLTSIIPVNQMLDINDINACIIKDGILKSVINQENQLINTNMFDEVTN